MIFQSGLSNFVLFLKYFLEKSFESKKEKWKNKKEKWKNKKEKWKNKKKDRKRKKDENILFFIFFQILSGLFSSPPPSKNNGHEMLTFFTIHFYYCNT